MVKLRETLMVPRLHCSNVCGPSTHRKQTANSTIRILQCREIKYCLKLNAESWQTQAKMYTNVHWAMRSRGRSSTQPQLHTSEIIIMLTGLQLDLWKTNSAVFFFLPCLIYSTALLGHYSQSVQENLPGSVFLLPSAPMMTSNSSSLTGCVLGWTSALQPIPAKIQNV